MNACLGSCCSNFPDEFIICENSVLLLVAGRAHWAGVVCPETLSAHDPSATLAALLRSCMRRPFLVDDFLPFDARSRTTHCCERRFACSQANAVGVGGCYLTIHGFCPFVAPSQSSALCVVSASLVVGRTKTSFGSEFGSISGRHR